MAWTVIIFLMSIDQNFLFNYFYSSLSGGPSLAGGSYWNWRVQKKERKCWYLGIWKNDNFIFYYKREIEQYTLIMRTILYIYIYITKYILIFFRNVACPKQQPILVINVDLLEVRRSPLPKPDGCALRASEVMLI